MKWFKFSQINEESYWLQKVSLTPSAITSAPEHLRKDENFLNQATRRNSAVVLYIDPAFATDNMYLRLLRDDSTEFNKIPSSLQTNEEFCIKAFRVNPFVYRFIPDEFRTLELSKSFLNQMPFESPNSNIKSFYKYIPEQFIEEVLEESFV